MAAEPFSELNPKALGSLLRQYVTLPLHHGAAAALTVAFEIRRADCLARGEQTSEGQIKEEIRGIYREMLGITDPDIGLEKLQQDALKKKR
jgi:hypothetical protein